MEKRWIQRFEIEITKCMHSFAILQNFSWPSSRLLLKQAYKLEKHTDSNKSHSRQQRKEVAKMFKANRSTEGSLSLSPLLYNQKKLPQLKQRGGYQKRPVQWHKWKVPADITGSDR